MASCTTGELLLPVLSVSAAGNEGRVKLVSFPKRKDSQLDHWNKALAKAR